MTTRHLLFALLKGFQTSFPVQKDGRFFRPQFLTDLAHACVNLVMKCGYQLATLSIIAFLYHKFPHPIQHLTQDWPIWFHFTVAFLVADLSFYWTHRCIHIVPFLWKSHTLHHSSEDVELFTGFRGHPLDILVLDLSRTIPAYLMGLPIELISCISILSSYYNFYIHSTAHRDWGPLNPLLNNPILNNPLSHHWHHFRGPECEHKNFGLIFSCWDWMFGSMYIPKDNKLPNDCGLPGAFPQNYMGQILYPFMPQRSLSKDAASVALLKAPQTPTAAKQAS